MRQWGVDEIKTLRELAVEGAGCEEIAVSLKRRQSDVRDMAVLIGISLEPAVSMQWCVRCGHPRSALDEKTGWCLPCTTAHKNRIQYEATQAEEAALLEEREREANAIRKERQRMREAFGTNPRKGRLAEQ